MAQFARTQPQGLARINRSNPLTRGLTGAFTPAMRNATPVNGASLTASREGIGYSTSATSDQWIASNTALVSSSPAWTILAVLAGTSTNTATGGVPFYVERPNGMQIVKLEMGDGGTNTAALVVRDSSGSIILQRGNVDIRTDTGKRRVIVGTRRASNDHRLYVNGVLDAAATGTVGGSFGASNAVIGCDPQDGSNGSLSGASLPLVLVWSRSLSDAEIAAVSANPWQLFESPSQTQFPQAAAATTGTVATATPAGVSASSAVGSAAAQGAANVSPAGVAAASAVGTAIASGSSVINGAASPAGVSATASVGSAAASGQGKASPAGVLASSAVGAATATGQAISYATPAGVSASAAVGTPSISAGARVYPLGVQATAYVGYAQGPVNLTGYPQFYAFTLMRADSVSASGSIDSTSAQFTLMRSDQLSAVSVMSADPLNYTANLI